MSGLTVVTGADAVILLPAGVWVVTGAVALVQEWVFDLAAPEFPGHTDGVLKASRGGG